MPVNAEEKGRTYLYTAKSLIEEQTEERNGPLLSKNPLAYYPINQATENDLSLILTHYGGFKGNDTQLAAANQWAICYASREGIIRYELLSPEKQAVFFQEDQTIVSDQSLFEEKHFISIRGSSPHVVSYSLMATDSNTIMVSYLMADSALTYYSLTETLVFSEQANQPVVVDYQTSELSLLQNFYQP